MKGSYGGCVAVIGSVTHAMRAQAALAKAAIPSNVIKTESSLHAGQGCTYGVSFSCSQSKNVRSVLEHERVWVKQWNGAD